MKTAYGSFRIEDFWSLHNDERDFSENSAVEKINELDNEAIETFQKKLHREKKWKTPPYNQWPIRQQKVAQHMWNWSSWIK